MWLRRSTLLVVLSLIPCPLFLSGCGGGKPEAAASANELDAFLQANPDVANEEAPDVEAE